MCGIVTFYGHNDGVERVLNALDLLAYRAPDSSGLAFVDEDEQLAIRRAVGTSDHLRAKIAEQPLPPQRHGDIQVVLGHGRWAMVGAVNETNAHPLTDRSQERAACENGSHNASLMLGTMAEQRAWWRARGLPENQPVHRSENTTEVLTCEWERLVLQLGEGSPPPGSAGFLSSLDQWDIQDPEERALRLAMWRLRQGNAHACTFYNRNQPETLYVTSHLKPIAIAIRTMEDGRRELMIASDVNAALMLWPKGEVESAARRISTQQQENRDFLDGRYSGQEEINRILDAFTVEVIFLDHDLDGGAELFARIGGASETSRSEPEIQLSHYDGRPVQIRSQRLRLNPAMVGKGSFPSYTESHIAEIPEVMESIGRYYTPQGQLSLQSTWHDDAAVGPGLNKAVIQDRFGPRLAGLQRLYLIGEGSSWRDAQAAAPLFRRLLPGVLVTVLRPVQLLNLGTAIEPANDLALEISWSGTTDSLLKVDHWLSELKVIRLAVSGRPQSDLGRRTAGSGGTLDVQTGVEVSVATVKGYQAILMVLDLLALALADMRNDQDNKAASTQLQVELIEAIPRYVSAGLKDEARRSQITRAAQRCKAFNKVLVIGNSPVDIEAELKIEELAQIVAGAIDFHAASLRPLIERCALVESDRQRVLFILNATSAEAQQEAYHIIRYLKELNVFCLIHTTPHEKLAEWQALPMAEIFVSPAVSPPLQPLIDAPFFFELAVALAYARGLTSDAIDRPRNLAKSVTTTGAERRLDIETRREFHNMSLAQFGRRRQAELAWEKESGVLPRAMQATLAMRAALAVLGQPLPERLALDSSRHLAILTDTEAIENGVHMAAGVWLELLGIDLTVYRRFMHETPRQQSGTAVLQIIRAGAVLALRDGQTIALPSDLLSDQQELLAAAYLVGLALRLAQNRGVATIDWETGLAQMPLIVASILADERYSLTIRGALAPYVETGYDKFQIIGGGQDFAAALSIARSIRSQGFMAEALYTDSAWHGPLATVGGPDADHDTLIIILATDPLFQAAALVDTQVYRTRNAQVLLVVPEGNQDLPAVQAVDPAAVLAVPAVPRPFTPMANAATGYVLAWQMAHLWAKTNNQYR